MKRSYNSDGIQTDTVFTPAPEGVYWLKIANVVDMKGGLPWKTKNGDDYVSVECSIDDVGDQLGKKVWHGVTFMEDKNKKGAGMSIHFLKTIGEPWEGEFEIDTDNWVGKRFRAKLVIGKTNTGKPKNEISYVLAEDETDEVPF